VQTTETDLVGYPVDNYPTVSAFVDAKISRVAGTRTRIYLFPALLLLMFVCNSNITALS